MGPFRRSHGWFAALAGKGVQVSRDRHIGQCSGGIGVATPYPQTEQTRSLESTTVSLRPGARLGDIRTGFLSVGSCHVRH